MVRELDSSEDGIFRRIFHKTTDALVILNTDDEIIKVNQTACQLYGYDEKEFLDLKVRSLIHPDYHHQFEKFKQDVMQQGTFKGGTKDVRKDGSTFYTEVRGRSIQVGGETLLLASIRDVTERVMTREMLSYREVLWNSLMENTPDLVYFKDKDHQMIRASQAYADIFGVDADQLVGKTADELWPHEAEEILADERQALNGDPIIDKRRKVTTPEGESVWYSLTKIPIYEGGEVIGFFAIDKDITDQVESQIEIVQRTAQLEALHDVGLEIIGELELDELLQSIAARAVELVQGRSGGFCMYQPEEDVLDFVIHTGDLSLPSKTTVERGEGLAGQVWVKRETIIVEDYREWVGERNLWVETLGNFSDIGIPVQWGDQFLGVLEVLGEPGRRFIEEEANLLEKFAVQAAIAIQNARLFEREKTRRKEAETLREVGMLLTSSLDRNEALTEILDQLKVVLPYDSASIQLIHNGKVVVEAVAGSLDPEQIVGVSFPIEKDELVRDIIHQGTGKVVDNVKEIDSWTELSGLERVHSWIGVPLITQNDTIGILTVDHHEIGHFSEHDADLASAFANQAAIALSNAQLYEEATRRLDRLSSLREIDRVITGSLDLQTTLDVLLSQLQRLLDVDAASVLTYQPELQVLEFRVGKGFRTNAFQALDQRLGRGLAGLATLERRPIHIANVKTQTAAITRQRAFQKEGFVGYHAEPLIAKGEVIGALEVFHRQPLHVSREWLDYLETLAGQAAIAIDRLNIFRDLEQSNVELLQAYDAVIEGWSRALELRDKKTEGHSTRVEMLTLKLARRMGVPSDDLVHIRRGTLLHDIGKMGIPDRILQKEEELTEEEWEIMKQHPQFAYDMLSPLDYLRPALDIPYCHHERWDGTGYPRGLEGEDIPLAARIFAVVDVWDALRSDRPYREAWSQEEALDYIRDQAGKEFDPEVVEVFLRLIDAPQS